MHRGPPPGRRQVHLHALIGDLSRTADLLTHGSDQLLGERHHVVVIGIGLIHLHRCEFGVVARAHPFVAKDPP